MKRLVRPLVLSAFVVAGITHHAKAGFDTYLSIGDSLAFGVEANDTSTDISNGDRGFVADYANIVAANNGGVRPNVINLGVSGETSSSFFGNGVGLDGPDASIRNTNYTGGTPPSQDALMLSTIQSQLAAGNTISTVTVSLGANDLFVALAENASFTDALATFQMNELTLLTQIRALLPTTNLVLLGYYDPYAVFDNDPASPYYPTALASAQAIPAINQYIAADAMGFGASFVNLQPLFAGNELNDTYITTGNVHPNDLGYQMIADALAVPEPSSAILVGLGLVAIVGRLRRRTLLGYSADQ